MIVQKLHDAGVRSEHLYLAGLVSVGMSIAAWMTSKKSEEAPLARADRWGIFVGLWAPTFVGYGNALAHHEMMAMKKKKD